MPKTLAGLECDKFTTNVDGETCVRVCADASIDVRGLTKHYNGTVGTSAIQIPATPDRLIAEVIIHATGDKALLVDFDPPVGVFKTIFKKSTLIWTPKNGITQFDIKGDTPSAEYEIIVNFRDT